MWLLFNGFIGGIEPRLVIPLLKSYSLLPLIVQVHVKNHLLSDFLITTYNNYMN